MKVSLARLEAGHSLAYSTFSRLSIQSNSSGLDSVAAIVAHYLLPMHDVTYRFLLCVECGRWSRSTCRMRLLQCSRSASTRRLSCFPARWASHVSVAAGLMLMRAYVFPTLLSPSRGRRRRGALAISVELLLLCCPRVFVVVGRSCPSLAYNCTSGRMIWCSVSFESIDRVVSDEWDHILVPITGFRNEPLSGV